jgi:predicted dehydrogenase
MQLNIGIVGAGGFAHFAAKSFLQVAGISIVSVHDINEVIARELSNELNAKVYTDYDALLHDSNINLIYIATPPFLHYQQSKKALLANKHVICEKPAALHAKEAEELVTIANSADLLYVVNLMQRYNILYDVVATIINEKLAGNFLHGFFENYASDEKLNAEHWFWDEEKSGGIFIEHGVHFFDMFSGWLGEGELVNAFALQSSINKKFTDRVQATVLYKDGFVNFYHGFNQPKILDRQEMRLQFEYGEITLYEWIPVKIRLHGIFTNQQLEEILKLLPNASVIHHKSFEKNSYKMNGRFADKQFDVHVTIESGNIKDKQNRYQQMVSAMITDQWNWIKNHKHVRTIDETNAVQSLKIAEEATQAAKNYITF